MRVPSHAAVAATVDLAAATVGERVTGLVNAVLRKVAGRSWDEWVGDAQRRPRRPRRAGAAQRPSAVDRRRVRRPAAGRRGRARAAGQQRVGAGEPGGPARTGRRSTSCWPPAPSRGAGARTRPGGPATPPSWPPSATAPPASRTRGPSWPPAASARVPSTARRRGWWLDLCAGPGGKSALLAGLAVRAVGPTGRRRARAAPGAAGRPGAARLSRSRRRWWWPTAPDPPGTPGLRPGAGRRAVHRTRCPAAPSRSRAGGGRRPTSRSCTRCRWPCSTSALDGDRAGRGGRVRDLLAAPPRDRATWSARCWPGEPSRDRAGRRGAARAARRTPSSGRTCSCGRTGTAPTRCSPPI